jgi:four helix bundle suffix protein
MSTIFKKSGGYRKLFSFNFATIIHLGAIQFCKAFIPWQEDSLGKTVGQMIGAARSGRINIAEGSERAGTSAETEIKLTDVARASLAELQNDLETFLAERQVLPWSIHDNAYQAVASINLAPFNYTEDTLHDHWVYLHQEKRKFDPWLKHKDPGVVANALIVLIVRTTGMLSNQMTRQEEQFIQDGGISERMHKVRTSELVKKLPQCPECGKPMKQRISAKGPFWGCTGYPACKVTQPFQ